MGAWGPLNLLGEMSSLGTEYEPTSEESKFKNCE